MNEDLYFDFIGIGFIWPRLEKIVAGMRKEMDESLFENAVWLAKRQREWKKEVGVRALHGSLIWLKCKDTEEEKVNLCNH
ncbi:MAG: hypothetical protein LVQ63_04375 [Thermoplasmatales archaeon]|nr:hypothetical protein [Thermoplasmatales archaeon]